MVWRWLPWERITWEIHGTWTARIQWLARWILAFSFRVLMVWWTRFHIFVSALSCENLATRVSATLSTGDFLFEFRSQCGYICYPSSTTVRFGRNWGYCAVLQFFSEINLAMVTLEKNHMWNASKLISSHSLPEKIDSGFLLSSHLGFSLYDELALAHLLPVFPLYSAPGIFSQILHVAIFATLSNTALWFGRSQGYCVVFFML